uniref:Uncharacterized protein n=1 Tax=Plectus sambesii TaxID=2011161 RepID=A0A914V8A6_9BILA
MQAAAFDCTLTNRDDVGTPVLFASLSEANALEVSRLPSNEFLLQRNIGGRSVEADSRRRPPATPFRAGDRFVLARARAVGQIAASIDASPPTGCWAGLINQPGAQIRQRLVLELNEAQIIEYCNSASPRVTRQLSRDGGQNNGFPGVRRAPIISSLVHPVAPGSDGGGAKKQPTNGSHRAFISTYFASTRRRCLTAASEASWLLRSGRNCVPAASDSARGAGGGGERGAFT